MPGKGTKKLNVQVSACMRGRERERERERERKSAHLTSRHVKMVYF